MTFSRFFGFGILLWLLLSLLKVVFLRVLNLDGPALQIIFTFLAFVITIACVRRLGVINYLEAMLVAIVWTLSFLAADFAVLQLLLGSSIFSGWVMWLTYVVVFVGIFFFHKKRHVQIRKELAAHRAHAHGHGGGDTTDRKH